MIIIMVLECFHNAEEEWMWEYAKVYVEVSHIYICEFNESLLFNPIIYLNKYEVVILRIIFVWQELHVTILV